MNSMLLGGLGLLAIAAAACTEEQPAAPAATAPAATIGAVSRADERPPPRGSRMPYFFQ